MNTQQLVDEQEVFAEDQEQRRKDFIEAREWKPRELFMDDEGCV
jgi:hypothetical protein